MVSVSRSSGSKGPVMAVLHVLVDFLQPDAAHPGDGVGEIAVDHRLADAHRLENLGALVGLQHVEMPILEATLLTLPCTTAPM